MYLIDNLVSPYEKILITAVAFLAFHPTHAQVDLKKSLVLYLPFDGNTKDASAYGNDAINYGATLAPDQYGRPNSASWMEIPHISSVGVSGTSLTISARVSDMMALIAGLENLQDGQTVHDCVCGSGRMLLNAAKHNRNGIFIGADIDATCCKMTVLNMLVNSMTGEVAHMDTLRLEHWGAGVTPPKIRTI